MSNSSDSSLDVPKDDKEHTINDFLDKSSAPQNEVEDELYREAAKATPSNEDKQATSSEEIEIISAKFNPESGDQLHEHKPKKRPGRPSKVGPSSKRARSVPSQEQFYIGKLSNLVMERNHSTAKRRFSKNAAGELKPRTHKTSMKQLMIRN